jgi:TonB family protein
LWNCGGDPKVETRTHSPQSYSGTKKTLLDSLRGVVVTSSFLSLGKNRGNGMASGAQAPGRDQPSRRRWLRYRVQALLDVTVVRSGVPDVLPGRSVNLGEGGLSAVLAGELLPGDAVGVEIRLPLSADPLRTRAVVRHHDKLRLGLEFVGLSAEQRVAIRDWAGTAKAELEPGVREKIPLEAGKGSESGGLGSAQRATSMGHDRRWIFVLAAAIFLLAVLWWRWNRGWEDLESGLQKSGKTIEAPQVQAHVPADVMLKLVTHRVDPDYPAAARPAKLQGVIVLDVVVARDGSVVDVRALNGPEVLAQAAIDAMRWWRFEPYRIDSKAVTVQTTVAMEFKP